MVSHPKIKGPHTRGKELTHTLKTCGTHSCKEKGTCTRRWPTLEKVSTHRTLKKDVKVMAMGGLYVHLKNAKRTRVKSVTA